MKAADVKRRWARWRDRLRERPTLDLVYRLTVGVVGTAVLIVGILAIPYPGPGWAIVFIGLGILATEFEWAQRVLSYAKQRYDKGMEWFHRQPAVVQILGGVFTALIVALTLWALGALDWTAERLGFDFEWLNSPIGIGD
ncbi:TIGR02611 family protein [Mycobacterium sp. IDR2000157661]|uniref:TIGR02611 family protein n=1 Tax=Mycobacterium sp. IDR2000157661 TaxID=2867005 RepID=UPI001EE9FF5C|nr:TIGR02611 family protein [Mycobacterium sp. IDR2000157661]ULE32855.1 TIGR02611 family protein [Mycobacterium sp. IDR2000157661]